MNHRRRTAPIGITLALTCVAALFAGCGSRLAQQSIADAARRPIVHGTASQAASTGNQASGVGGTDAGVTTTTAPSSGGSTATTSPTGSAGSIPSGKVGTSGGSTAGSTSGTASSGAATLSTINLGNVGTYSGVIGSVFAGAQQSLEVWEAYTNAHGGLNGHPVHVYFEDDGGDPSTSATDVQQEVTQDHVIAFVGDLMPLTVSASVPYLQQQNIPVIGGDASSFEWWQSPILFPQASGISNENDPTFKAAVARGYTKMGLLYCIEDSTCTNAYTQGIQKGGAKADGVDPVYVATYSITQPDLTAECLDAKQAGATFIYFAGDGDSLVRMASDCAAQGYNPLYEADSIAVSEAIASDSHLNGLLSVQTNFPWPDAFTPAQQLYQQAVKDYDPSLVGSASTSAEWASGELAVAADKFLTANPTSAEFLQGLWSIKNNNLGGLSPPLTFTQGAPATMSSCYFLMKLQNGTFTDLNNGTTQCS